ncbi:MAG: tagatose 1,6-diphosphate aldolase [Proteobacteria bacterium]|nr:tagatose 1,6-diphosphate aldolase [Pseudomonadota bacterium]
MAKETTARYFLGMGPGKLNGLRRVADGTGRFKVLACDQNNSFRRMIAEARGRDARPEELVEAKSDIVHVLGAEASAVLLDVNYGARQALNSGALPRQPGLLIRLEASKPAGERAEIEAGWGVEQIKRFGADGVKLLVYLDTESKSASRSQVEFVRTVHAECQEHDILLMLEELSYPRKDQNETKSSTTYLQRQPDNILRAVELLGPLCDVLKVEFPGHLPTMGEQPCRDNLERLNATAARPWVLLSAGVDFEDFLPQVELAMGMGASGIMAGRAVFKEYFRPESREKRVAFLNETALPRWRRLCDIVDRHATPWQDWVGVTRADLAAQVLLDWHKTGSAA